MNFWPNFSQNKKGGIYISKEGVEDTGMGEKGVKWQMVPARLVLVLYQWGHGGVWRMFQCPNNFSLMNG